MAYTTSGTLTTDEREVAISETWETQTDWEAYQSKSGIAINSGSLELSQLQVIDDFEQADLSSYKYTENSGGGDNFALVGTSDAYHPASPQEGNQFLGYSGGISSASIKYSEPGEGLNYYPTRGDVIGGWYHQGTSGNNTHNAVCFLGDGALSAYAAVYNDQNGYIELHVDYEQGNANVQTSTSLSADTWYYWEIDTDAISFTVWDSDSRSSEVASVSLSDSTYTNQGGIGFVANAGGGSLAEPAWDIWEQI